ncbi:MAG: FGGY family carbohydrate kinase [Ignavibacteriaceae bacterium]|nr:FGGY family carbohydrate kinase [Ignavibacteriaceae bacterium]
MLSLGYDVGSSSIKASIIDIETGKVVTSDFYPKEEMKINSPHPGWAEQDPESWWECIKILTAKVLSEGSINKDDIKCIGISYQMHGLVIVDKIHRAIRPSIIWCDSRAVETGKKAFEEIGGAKCLEHLLNSPGNFTASKLKWVKDNEPDNYKKINKFMLPGDFIGMKLTGEAVTTVSGLSEGILWDFKTNSVSKDVLSYYDIDEKLISDVKPTFSVQGKLTRYAADELGLSEGTVVSYRAGDQPNNAFSLNVLNPGEIAATAGTSGVVYGVIDKSNFDPLSRVNPFVHVNNTNEQNRFGVLLCINGTGILNSWTRKNFANGLSYNEMNLLAEGIEAGSNGISVLPFGNGAERVLENKSIGCRFIGIDFNRHSISHVLRAVQEGIAFSFRYGIDIMKEMGLDIKIIRAGKANMFLSPVFSQTLANVTGASIELYDTDGSQGAARGAAYGAGFYKSFDDAFKSLNKTGEINPVITDVEKHLGAYELWLSRLNSTLLNK